VKNKEETNAYEIAKYSVKGNTEHFKVFQNFLTKYKDVQQKLKKRRLRDRMREERQMKK
jgi:hypothetical protein